MPQHPAALDCSVPTPRPACTEGPTSAPCKRTLCHHTQTLKMSAAEKDEKETDSLMPPIEIEIEQKDRLPYTRSPRKQKTTAEEREMSMMRIEHVVSHIEDLADMEEDPENDEDAKQQAEQRKHLWYALQTIADELTEKCIFADKLIETNHDDLAELSEHLLKHMNEDKDVLSDEQLKEAAENLHHHHHHGDLGAAMANGLAIVTIFMDSLEKRKYAFSRLKENVHLGEADNKGVQFIFVILEPFEEDKNAVKKMDIARAMSLIINQESLRDKLITCDALPDQPDPIQKVFSAEKGTTFSMLMADVENWKDGKRAGKLDWEAIEKKHEKDTDLQKKLKQKKIELLKSGKLLATSLSPNAEGLKWVREEWPFGGLKRDIKRRMCSTVYLQDWKDGFTLQSIAVVLFMFFACVAPGIAFGSLLAKATCVKRDPNCDGPLVVVPRNDVFEDASLCPCTAQMGVIEMLFSSGLCGIAYSIFGGSPLTILGGTGPVMVFTGVLFDLTESLEVEFFPFYCWTGIWIGVYSVILAVTDAACVISAVTRFTDEIFAALISTIFTISSITDLYKVWEDGKEQLCENSPGSATSIQNLSRTALENIADDKTSTGELPCMPLVQLEAKTLVSIFLALGTTWIALQLKGVRGSQITHRNVRKFMADFGVAIAIGTMVLVHELVFTTPVDMLLIPEKFETTSGRDWWVDPFQLSVGWIFFTMIPAAFGLTLVWLDDNITYRLINSTDNKVVKGTAYHYNTLILGVFIATCSLFGLPWLVAATVRSMLMVKSLAQTEKDGAGRERIVSVNDNRLCAFLIHVLVLASVFLPDVLKKIPKPVIFGLFLYMGLASMSGNTMFQRIELMGIWEAANYPSESYIKKVSSMMKIHWFTGIQVLALVVLYVVKSSPIGIAFPLFIGVLPFLRWGTGKLLGEDDCEILDPEEKD
eukprot:SAG31_NODE_251_length_19069_cov_5.843226_9_plen_932_part_00